VKKRISMIIPDTINKNFIASIIKGAVYFETAPLILFIQLIGFNKQLEVGLRMYACRACFRCAAAFMYVPAVSAFPENLIVSFENDALFNIAGKL
jgi:hypothetical protein